VSESPQPWEAAADDVSPADVPTAPGMDAAPDLTATEGAEPEAAEPEATTPEATTPEATTPEATAPEPTAPEAAAPEVAAPEPPTSSDPRVADALSLLAEVQRLPLEEQVEVFADIHRRLTGVLADPDSQA
jgi:hypothetical protein